MKLAVALLVTLATFSTARADAPSDADLKACLGPAKSWTPTVFSKLKAKMSPDAVAKEFPGADKVSQYGFVTLAADKCAGAKQFEFYFAKNKKTQAFELSRVTLKFDPALSTDAGFYDALVKATSAKYGKIKKQEEIQKKLITWVNSQFKTAQLTEMPGHDGAQLQLATSL